MLLRSISFAAVLLVPVAVLAQQPNGDELQQSYQAVISDLSRDKVALAAQILADKREIARLKAEAEKSKPEEKHGP